MLVHAGLINTYVGMFKKYISKKKTKNGILK